MLILQQTDYSEINHNTTVDISLDSLVYYFNRCADNFKEKLPNDFDFFYNYFDCGMTTNTTLEFTFEQLQRMFTVHIILENMKHVEIINEFPDCRYIFTEGFSKKIVHNEDEIYEHIRRMNGL